MSESTLHLYEIADEIQELGAILAEHDGELTPELEERFDRIEGALPDKVERTALFIRDLEETAEGLRREEKRLWGRRKALENKASHLKDYLHFQLRRIDREKVETDKIRVRRQQNSRPSIKWTRSEDEIPDAFRRVRVSADTQAAYREWKNGGDLPDGFSVERGEHLRIE